MKENALKMQDRTATDSTRDSVITDKPYTLWYKRTYYTCVKCPVYV